MLYLQDYLPLLHNTYALLQSWSFIMTLICRLYTFFTSQRIFFHKPHWFSIHGGECHRPRICLQIVSSRNFQLEPPKGLLLSARAKEVHKSQDMCFWENNIQKMFSSQKTTEKHPISVKGSFSARNTQLMVPSQKPSQGNIFSWQLQKEWSWNCSQTTTNLPRDHRVLHLNCFARKSVSFVSNSKT